MKQIYCFCCAGVRDAKGSVQRDWGFGPRHFCAKCAPRVKDMPQVDHGPASEHEVARPEVAVRPAKKTAPGTSGKAQSMAEWVRQNVALGVEELIRRLPEVFPDSKPGQNPKLSKGYVNCYLKKEK